MFDADASVCMVARRRSVGRVLLPQARTSLLLLSAVVLEHSVFDSGTVVPDGKGVQVVLDGLVLWTPPGWNQRPTRDSSLHLLHK